MAKNFEWRHEALTTALNGNPATLEERSVHVFTLGFAMKKFKKKIQIRRNLKVRLTQDNKVADI